MTGSRHQITCQHSLYITKDLGVAGRVQAVAAIVYVHAMQEKTTGIASHASISFNNTYPEIPSQCQLPGSPQPCRAGSQNDDMRFLSQ